MKRAALAAVTTLVGGAAVIYGVAASSVAPQPTVAQRPAPALTEQVVVGRVVDGDTFAIADQRRVRILVMDSCERNTPAGPRATADARRLLEGRLVTLHREPGAPDVEQDVPWEPRLLRYVELPGGGDFAETMLRQSHTGVYAGRSDASPVRLARGNLADRDGRDCSR